MHDQKREPVVSNLQLPEWSDIEKNHMVNVKNVNEIKNGYLCVQTAKDYAYGDVSEKLQFINDINY